MPSDCAFADPVDEDPAGELRSCCLSGFTRLLRQIASGPGVEAEGARWCNAAVIRASALCSSDSLQGSQCHRCHPSVDIPGRRGTKTSDPIGKGMSANGREVLEKGNRLDQRQENNKQVNTSTSQTIKRGENTPTTRRKQNEHTHRRRRRCKGGLDRDPSGDNRSDRAGTRQHEIGRRWDGSRLEQNRGGDGTGTR
ncbi:hypothetical protein AV530_011257 [Patagioenas fasciata monilis]|uniref:Uncharacterized protein n=1 Tax=Patagioenas fasciata monilis TaxID=372326 RepID=A0A1V4KNQ5_PATFA|nr:hypothetical protein AV530_011257 [Patagioenas fasciata monilis]